VTAYYNENDPKPAAWLRELIRGGHIAPGTVDERSIEDVTPNDLRGFDQHHFFAGIGGWSRALRLAGWPDERPVWTGSCPCQPFSAAGSRTGFADERHLWPAFFHLIQELRPTVVFGEQVGTRDGLKWLDLVSTDLEAEGYSFGAADLCAAGVGAPHARQRLYFVGSLDNPADTRYDGEGERDGRQSLLAARSIKPSASFWFRTDRDYCQDGKARFIEPGSKPLAHGIPARVGRLRGYGNAIVPQVAAAFIQCSQSDAEAKP
jgi:DNA (cytosine-5)-methyltransferase 1